jgi:flagellar motor switch protein FliN/FliY
MTDTAPSMTAPEGDVDAAVPLAAGIATAPGPAPAPAAAVAATSAPAGSMAALAGGERSLDLLHGVEMTVTVELGRTKMLLRDLLALQTGSVIELDRAAGSPVDVLINDNLLARGEVVVLDDEFGVRILDIVMTDGQPARH